MLELVLITVVLPLRSEMPVVRSEVLLASVASVLRNVLLPVLLDDEHGLATRGKLLLNSVVCSG